MLAKHVRIGIALCDAARKSMIGGMPLFSQEHFGKPPNQSHKVWYETVMQFWFNALRGSKKKMAQQNPTVREAYVSYSPPISVSKIIIKLISGIPTQYSKGLRTVVLTNVEAMSYAEKKRKIKSKNRKIAIANCGALYHSDQHGKTGWIEIFVDNVLTGWPKAALTIPLVSEIALGIPLFHELGHHWRRTNTSRQRKREELAEELKRKLLRIYFRIQYWYLIPLLYFVSLISKSAR